MRKAETVLSIIHDRGQRGLHLEDVYRQLFNPDLYLRAYERIGSNAGALTKGITDETVDGMSLKKIESIIEELRYERYRWTPVRRVYIPKSNGKVRPLGVPVWKDKLLQEVMRQILEAYYEPQFSEFSHGFRPKRGCHTALIAVRNHWLGTKWFIEGDIKGCFDNIDHSILLNILQEKIRDNRFIRLIKGLLEAGYCEEWNYKATLSGTPQGGVISPILANIYLDKLDKFVETLLPEYNKGKRRKQNAEYNRLNCTYHRLMKKGETELAKEYRIKAKSLPTFEPTDPDFRRLRYVRYADDFLLGYLGTKSEALEIKERIRNWTRENLNLELSEEKTLITHAASEPAKFLGYEIMPQFSESKRSANGYIMLRVPRKFVTRMLAKYTRKGKPIHRAKLLDNSDYEIVAQYQAELRGYAQYYILAQNLSGSIGYSRKIMFQSLLKTFAGKYRTEVTTIWVKHRQKIKTEHGLRMAFVVKIPREGKNPLVAYFAGFPLCYKKYATIRDKPLFYEVTGSRNQLGLRLLFEICEICGANTELEMHHIRKLKDIKIEGKKELPKWKQYHIAKRRKTIAVCRSCHTDIHTGKRGISKQLRNKLPESRMK